MSVAEQGPSYESQKAENNHHWDYWRNMLLPMLIALAAAIAAFLLIWLIASLTLREPPVRAWSLTPADLGTVCPGDSLPLKNKVSVDAESLLFYYISIMDKTGTYNIVGTQETFTGFPHPRAGEFEQVLPWRVPGLPPGDYIRVFTARGTDGAQKPVHLEASFTLGDSEKCPHLGGTYP